MQLKHLGPYNIDKPLGKGGMGSVYAATDTQTGQRVAIKALTPHLAMAEGFRERFEAEIESLKTLRHEGIVRLYGYGEQDGVLFYSMELVEGISLEDELRAGRRFNWRDVTSIAIQLSLALKHAHDHGIVHRDIKPANILLYNNVGQAAPDAVAHQGTCQAQPDLREERVKLADFGIARLFGTTQLTTAGGVLGTADYMSPEQAEGRPVTPKCDQYSLGGVMYALLAGRPPFLAQNLPQMLQLQRFARPDPVRRYAPDTPEQLERIIAQLLAKDPADRFPNTQVLARHLQAMTMALSRPAADDQPLDGHDSAERDAAGQQSLAIETTRSAAGIAAAEPEAPSGGGGAPPISEDAATVAAEDIVPLRQPTSVRTRGATVLPTPQPSPRAVERPARFTTLEEEAALLQGERQRSWWMVAGQLAGFAAILAAIAAAAAYLSRPLSADELYQAIMSRVESDDDTALATIANEMDEFLMRFPLDARAAELERYKQRIELDKLERKFNRQSRGQGALNASLLPVEQLYLRAVAQAEISPDQGAAMMQAIVDLHGPDANSQENPQVTAVVQLAKRRLETLRQQEGQLAWLNERMAAAAQLAKSNSRQAAAMYRAIVELYANEAWANEAVAEARRQLAVLEDVPP
jgi:serine/threonine-protein kinase